MKPSVRRPQAMRVVRPPHTTGVDTSAGSAATRARVLTLAIDVGGSHLKAAVVSDTGGLLTERIRVDTPIGSAPKATVRALTTLATSLGAYDRVSVGFPGVVRNGRILTAHNLDHAGWKGFDLAAALEKALGKPVRIANDADVAGLAVIAGSGVEMIITLGTGFGTGLYVDGALGPHLELAHHPFRKGETYEAQLGNTARKRVGRRKWNKRVKIAIETLRALTGFDRLYVGGGNVRKIDFEPDPDVTLVANQAGLEGGIALWRD